MTQKGSGGAKRGNTSQQEEFRVVIVGDGGCGKTSLLSVYTAGVFPEVRAGIHIMTQLYSAVTGSAVLSVIFTSN